jgi:hypothetical protein
MLRAEATNSSTNERSNVEFFDDDTIDTVRQQIGRSLGIHPDRLFILVKVERSKDYYKNQQNWEALFNRLSFADKYVERVSFSEYQTFTRSPATSIPWEQIDRAEWMDIPDSVEQLHSNAFSEYLIFGVPEKLSFILPRKFDTLASKIQASQFPIPDSSKLFSTMYDHIEGFYCIPYDDTAEPVAHIYFPLLREGTPERLTSEETILLEQNKKKLNGLLALKSPEPTEVSIIRTHFHIPWINTDFGSAVSSRFEQIFYGLTVSKEVPCISMFTSNNEISRHKFFVKNTKEKEPFLDLNVWNSWWTNTKPSRNRPTLVLYRGKNSQHSDRVSITDIDMVISTYRPDGNTETMEELAGGVREWIQEFDSILPFISESDIQGERWKIQDISFVAKYSKKIEEYDLRRFHCISSIFDADTQASTFKLLRADTSVHGVEPLEMMIIQLMRNNSVLGLSEIAKELNISIDRARLLDQRVRVKLAEKPDLLTKSFRGIPTMRLGPNTIHFSSTNRLEKSIQYANILRYILTSDSDDVETLCPKRMETVAAKEFRVDTNDIDDAVADDYMDLIEGIGDEKSIKEEEIEEETPNEKFIVKDPRKTMYNYFNLRLQKFDGETYGDAPNEKNKYTKECNQKYQPIILSEKDLKRVEPTNYDPRRYASENEQMVIPKGVIICPEYWCMKDEIPLREDQLINEDGFQRCPMCHGKININEKQNPQDYPVKKRDKSFRYPRLTKYKSPLTGKLMPCCYSTARTGTNTATEGKYYILGETKVDIPAFRLSFVPQTIIDSLHLKETYESFRKHKLIQAPMAGYFRVGLGRPSETLPKILNVKTAIPTPSEKPEITMKCSFFATWTKMGEGDDPISKRVSGINDSFKKHELSIIQELEYTALALHCDIFRIVNSSKFECFFRIRMNTSKDKGIIILQDGDVFTILSFVRRSGNSLEFSSNIYKDPFGVNTRTELEKLQTNACMTQIPSYENAISALTEIGGEYSVIMDPFMRGQALYVPGKVILPFQASAIPDIPNHKLNGFEDAKELPTHSNVLQYLDIAKKYSLGYEWAEDMFSTSERTEIRLKSGLRIPVVPEKIEHSVNEVIESVNSVGEENMTFGEEDENLKETYQEVSYASEVFEFMLFELSKTLDDSPELKDALKNPTRQILEPPLKKWFNRATQFVDISKPTEFVSKIRTPCGQFKKNTCSGNVCGWDGKTCRIQIKKSLQKETLFHRLLSTLTDNAKIRATVTEERVTPFFSTILYMELPHELILTDLEIKA